MGDGTGTKLPGKAFQVNENTVEEGASPAPPWPETVGDGTRTKLRGTSFQVNDNTVEEGEALGSSVPPRRG